MEQNVLAMSWSWYSLLREKILDLLEENELRDLKQNQKYLPEIGTVAGGNKPSAAAN